ncbi:hypothetical protein J3R30DRAFT_201991 [Lentinula aciculospora]|uniref:Uncharacterized protein n=1 Tax=Lentinula aciculospora TaxID=153920 RepID=A0A9W9AA51_9AGAR|nr:hypothetical protein J3R30DRAFT_201991 [Lentinula aciculospora]
MSTDSSRGPEEPVKLRVYQNFLHANTTQYEALNTVNIQTVICDETGVTRGAVNAVKGTNKPLGCSVGLHPKDQTISAIAISNSGNRCLVVEFTTQLGLRATGRRGSRTAFDLVRAMIEDVLCLPTSFYAFDLAPLALALYRELNIRITDGVDIQSAFPGSRKTSLEAILAIIGDDAGIRVDKDHIISAFEDLSYDPKLSSNRTALIQRAWISQFIAGYENAPEQFDATRHIDTTTKTFSNEKLDILSKWAADSVRLQYMKPLETEHTVMVGPGSNEAGGFHARSVVYKNRLRPDKPLECPTQSTE